MILNTYQNGKIVMKLMEGFTKVNAQYWKIQIYISYLSKTNIHVVI